MNAFDTNILLYARDPRDQIEQEIAFDLIQSLTDPVLLWQVACEYVPRAESCNRWATVEVTHGKTSRCSRRFGRSDFRRVKASAGRDRSTKPVPFRSGTPSWGQPARTRRLRICT